jgi:quinol monooxygenase YgiN
MAEVLLICRFVARTGTEVQLRALLQGMLAPTYAEPGCKRYELYESDSRGRFFLYETWESQAALDQHMATPHFKRLKQTGEEHQCRKEDSDRRRRGVILTCLESRRCRP